jgi:CBS domain-containing protein
MKVKSILATKSTNVITIRPEQSVKDAVILLAKHDIGVLVVVNEAGEPVGIISERDIIHAAAKREDVFSQAVSKVMTKDVIAGVPQDELTSVAHTMTEKRFGHLPIIDKGKLVGVISIRDVMEAQRDEYQGEVDTLRTQMIADDD